MCSSIVDSIGVWGVHLGVLDIGRQVVGLCVVVIFRTEGTVVFFFGGEAFSPSIHCIPIRRSYSRF